MTFELGFQHRSWFGCKEDLLCMPGETVRFVTRGQDELAEESGPVPDIIILIILGQVENILAKQFGLLWVGYAKFGSQVQNLQLHNVLL